MRNAQRDPLHAKLCGDLLSRAIQRDGGPPADFPHHLEIHPAHSAPPARPQRLHGRFLGRESPGIPFVLILELLAVGALGGSVDAPEKGLAITLDGRLDARDFRNVHAETDNQGASRDSEQLRASDYTWVMAKAKSVRQRARVTKKPAKTAAAKKRVASGPATDLGSSGWTERVTGAVRVLQVAALSQIPWLVHGFSTRPGGVSELDGEKVLNLSFTDWDKRENVKENRKRFVSALGAADATRGMELVALKQIHSDVVCVFDAPPTEACKGDASITDEAGLLLGVQTADCVPILLVDPKNRAVAAVHAGWRGTLARILAKTIGQMQMHFGSKPAELLAAIGPSVGGCCYEVGTEVAIQFTSQFADAADYFDELRTGEEPNPLQWMNMMPPGHQPPPKNVLLDLRKANRAQLLAAGLRDANIFVSDLCTACRRDLLFSYRKEGAGTGRMLSTIGVLGM
jgi:YfiH family protein